MTIIINNSFLTIKTLFKFKNKKIQLMINKIVEYKNKIILIKVKEYHKFQH
jgi:hypothetical protein